MSNIPKMGQLPTPEQWDSSYGDMTAGTGEWIIF